VPDFWQALSAIPANNSISSLFMCTPVAFQMIRPSPQHSRPGRRSCHSPDQACNQLNRRQ
jgi:hypothetical protein